MAFMDLLLGKGSKTKTKPIYDPNQEEILNQILNSLSTPLGAGLQNLQNILGGDPQAFEAFEAPTRRAFEEKTLPTIAERFTGMFGEGSQRSSAFGQQVGAAGRQLEEGLASQRAGLQTDALSQLLGLLRPALSPRKYQYTTPRTPGFLESVGTSFASQAGSLLPLLSML